MVDTADTNLLEDALADLKASPDEADEEHLPLPSDKALQSADHVLRAIYRIWPRRFEVYLATTSCFRTAQMRHTFHA